MAADNDDDVALALRLQAEELERDRQFRAAAAAAGVADADNQASALTAAVSAAMAPATRDDADNGTDAALARHLLEEDAAAHKAELERAATFDCPVCMEALHVSELITLECDHRLCQECFEGYVTAKVGEKVVGDALVCPLPPCTTAITPAEVRGNVPAPLFDKYLAFAAEVSVEADENHVRCPACNLITLFPPSTEAPDLWKRATCPNHSCGHRFCALCKDECHDGTCDEFREWKVANGKADAEFERLFREEEWRRCPHCRMPVSLDEGCFFMTCKPPCNGQFCFLCGVKLTEADHYSHYPAGPYSRPCANTRRRK